MDADRWQRVQDLFDRAAPLGADDRDALLRLECAHDPGLRREVESLLAFERDDSTFIENAIADAASSIREAQMGAGGRIGPYRVLRELARGGAGVVYLAERADDAFRLEVAIKLAPIGMYDQQSLRRFRSERQILASFDHPNIARLIDGGTTTDGVPYLVMEYIPGEPIDEYSDSHRLTIADRAGLVRAICSAVEYAHGNGVIHRDIKPGNIQMTSARVPKLLDFGIAKLLDPDQMPHTIARTRTGLRLMTPDYASPEQAWGDPVTKATDVYAIGALLYDLATGRPPHTFASHMPLEVSRVLSEEDPPVPSSVVLEPARTGGGPGREPDVVPPDEIAARRGTTPPGLRRALAGDLDSIILKALSRKPEDRYVSALEMSEDLRRFLDGQPVSARGGGWAYRAGKFLRRTLSDHGRP